MKTLTLDLTSKCNLNCEYCYVNRKLKDMSLKKIIKLLKQGVKNGFTHLIVSGGEPLLRRDLIKILKTAKELKYAIRLNTNGTLITDDFCKKVKNLVDVIQVTIDGSKDTHNKLRSRSYDKALLGLKKIIKHGIKVCVATVLSKDTYKEIPHTIKLCETLGVDYYRLIRLIPHKKELKSKVVTKKMNKLLIKYLKAQNKVKPKIFYEGICTNNCPAGKEYLGVNPDGSIVPCIFYQKIIGKNFKQAQKSDALKEILNNPCKGCKALAYYGG